MISLHDVFKEGTEAVKAAVLAFGARHLNDLRSGHAEPNWKHAEKHFTYLIEGIMGAAAPQQPGAAATVRRAENEAIDLLLALHGVRDYRCPICVKQQRPPL
ncbi:hypothetical protein OOK58_01670 [Streptomyces sp. NBC_01728]|uniref:hypothetical protein n=1 Tax=unclassified Streptomyces TaxID=2593676 RepID=UPI0022536249|nr:MULTISPECIES: hypothetical protein [unclassified Streptomyces]MCX4461406.1 hypothetical protein [Streptomyces sp. NBC_01719]MCX4490314.1 hypothetical protein [Streptomyces sp. NBC_01728]MCX4597110.1 hypothetical protein [Streptomyces sp. NBC_01549]